MTTKTLDRSQYMQALGLFTMARIHADRARSFRDELLALVGAEDLSCIEDAIWEDGAGPKEFDQALKNEDIAVEAK